MALARMFTTYPSFQEWINLHDDGSLESDHKLIKEIGWANPETYLDLDGASVQAIQS